MENDTEVIRQQMADTRNSLSEKVEAVEEMVSSAVKETTAAVTKTVENVTSSVENTVNTVKDTLASTVSTVQDSVSSTVNTVKDTVSDSVESVKQAFDVSGYVDKYPWAMMGGAAALGYALGSLLPSTSNGSRSGSSYSAPSWGSSTPAPLSSAFGAPAPTPTSTASSAPSGDSTVSSLKSMLPEGVLAMIDKLKGLAIGTAAGVVGEMVMNMVPADIKPELSRILDDTTQSLGGTIVRR